MEKEEFITKIRDILAHKDLGEKFNLAELLIPGWDEADNRGPLGIIAKDEFSSGTFNGPGYKVVLLPSPPDPSYLARYDHTVCQYQIVSTSILLKTATAEQLHQRCAEVGWEKVIEAHHE
jgi:hypothetical protein